MHKLSVNNLEGLKNFLSTLNTEEYDLVNYVWIEYGFYPILFNELFLPFFKETKGKKLGICFPGHEIFYEPHVDVLITLDGFIDTKKAYSDNKETDLLIHNFQTQHDRGIAFWFTLRNFDENKYYNTINQFKFRNMIYPIGDKKPWEHGLFSLPPGFHYGGGEDGNWSFQSNLWNSTGRLSWNVDTWNPSFEKIETGFTPKYNAFFVKNSWKNRNYSSGNINDFIVGAEGTGGQKSWSYIDYDFYLDVVNYHIENKIKLVIISDLVKFSKIESEYIEYLDMYSYFNVKLFVNVINNAENFISICTSPMDIATYYCDTNLIYLNDPVNVVSFAETVQKIKNKKCMAYHVSSNNINELFNFIDFTK